MLDFYQIDENKSLWLTKLGLTYTQARIYTFLDAYNDAQAKNITNFLKLPKQDVYKTLNELYEKGLIEKLATKPVIYRAIPARKCLELLSEQEKQRNLEIEKAAKKAFENTSKKKTLNSNLVSNHLTLFLKKESILIEAKKQIDEAKKSICVISPSKKLLPWIYMDCNLFQRAIDRKVKIKIITNTHIEQKYKIVLEKLEVNSSFEIKYLPYVPDVSFGIYDDKLILFETEANNDFLEAETVLSDNSCFVNMASNYFKMLYKQIRTQK